MPAAFPVTEHVAKSTRHTTFYLACGAEDAPAIIFIHGWPELSISWRHQLPVFAALGFRAIAPDMRGYGRSSVYPRHEDYALEHTVQDMIELIDSLGRERAVWVGHDWGSPVVWSMASHHPERCFAVANLCVPYISRGFAPGKLHPAGGSHGLSGGRVPGRPVGIHVLLRGEFCRRLRGVRRQCPELSEGDVPGRIGGRPGPALADRPCPSERWLVRRRGTGARPAGGHAGADRGGSAQIRIRAAAQRLLRAGFLVYEPHSQRRFRRQGAGTTASWPCPCCFCMASTTTPARPSPPAWPNQCGRTAQTSPRSSCNPDTGWHRRSRHR